MFHKLAAKLKHHIIRLKKITFEIKIKDNSPERRTWGQIPKSVITKTTFDILF